jgi:hypothetical protein
MQRVLDYAEQGTFRLPQRRTAIPLPFFEVTPMKAWITVPLIALALAGCAGKTAYRESCATQLDAAWKELDLAKSEGFAGAVSYAKALSLLTGAKTQQQLEGYDSCTAKAEKARFYIRESRAGR